MIETSSESTAPTTQRDFAAWAVARARLDPLGHYELLNGRIIMNPPAGYPHGAVESRAVRLLANFVFDRQLGEVFGSSQGFELPSADTVEPDASYVSRARWAAAPAPEAGSFLRVAPDLVVEILSGATAARDRGEKRAIYERNGVGEYWLVDPAARSLTLLVLEGVSYGAGRVLGEHDEVASSVLPGLRFRVAQVLP